MVEILNDHRNLMYFWTPQNLNHQQACWSLFLAQFELSLIHRPGQHSANWTLSQWADHLTEEEDNHDRVMLSTDKFNKSSEPSESLVENSDNPAHVLLEGEEANILECVCNCTDQDDSVV